MIISVSKSLVAFLIYSAFKSIAKLQDKSWDGVKKWHCTNCSTAVIETLNEASLATLPQGLNSHQLANSTLFVSDGQAKYAIGSALPVRSPGEFMPELTCHNSRIWQTFDAVCNNMLHLNLRRP